MTLSLKKELLAASASSRPDVLATEETVEAAAVAAVEVKAGAKEVVLEAAGQSKAEREAVAEEGAPANEVPIGAAETGTAGPAAAEVAGARAEGGAAAPEAAAAASANPPNGALPARHLSGASPRARGLKATGQTPRRYGSLARFKALQRTCAYGWPRHGS